MACPDLRATQGPEKEVGSLARAYARFVPNFGPKAGRKWTNSARNGPFPPRRPPGWNFATASYTRLSLRTSSARGYDGGSPTPGDVARIWESILVQNGRFILGAELAAEILGTADLLIDANLTHELRPWAIVEHVVVA